MTLGDDVRGNSSSRDRDGFGCVHQWGFTEPHSCDTAWRWAVVSGAREFLAAYDQQLRTDAETLGAMAVTRLGPLTVATFAGGRGFVTYGRPDRMAREQLPALIPRVLDLCRANPAITQVEWKTRGHDAIPGLDEALVAHGFEREAPESIMVGEARVLAVDLPLPPGVALRHISREADARAMIAMQSQVFGPRTDDRDMLQYLLARLLRQDGMQLWVAEADGEIVSAGRIEPVAGTDFAGLWGGATLPAWRRRGIYRALTAARARAALAMGKTLIQSDSTEYSRPILERSGLLKVSTTTPYRWSRPPGIGLG